MNGDLGIKMKAFSGQIVKVEISFQLTYKDWKKLKKLNAWKVIKIFLEKVRNAQI